MKYLKNEEIHGAECADDAVKPTQLLEGKLAELANELAALDGRQNPRERARALVDSAYVLLDLERKTEAWDAAWEAFDLAIPEQDWEQGVQACDVMVQAEQPESVKALAHGIWLGVTYPVDPELSVAMLQHLIDETPPEADGAAVAAAVARYLVDLRAEGKQREDLQFFTGQMLGEVARKHGKVDSQELFEFWMDRFELNDPSKILPRLAQVIDVLVTDQWWFDRDQLREQLPQEQ